MVNVSMNADGLKVTKQQSLNFWDCSDPYVELVCGNVAQKTKVVQDNLNPEFNETFSFTAAPSDQLTLKVWDFDAVKADDLLGTLEIPLFKLKAGEIYNQW